jgi:hypothetical protein
MQEALRLSRITGSRFSRNLSAIGFNLDGIRIRKAVQEFEKQQRLNIPDAAYYQALPIPAGEPDKAIPALELS